jgi:signal transduction histidine kinase
VSLVELRHRILGSIVERWGADAVALIGLGEPDGELTILDQIGLDRAPEGLVGDEADLRLVGAEHAHPIPRPGRGAGSIARILHLAGQRAAVTAGLGPHGARQVLVAARARGRFDAAVPEALAGLARVLASADRRHHVAETAERRTCQQAAVAALGQGALGGGEDLAELARATCEAASANLSADLVAVLERGPDGLVPSVGMGCAPERLSAELAWAKAPCAAVLRSEEPLVGSHLEGDPDRDPLPAATPAQRSLLIVPIRTGVRVAGLLLVASRAPVTYSEDDVAFASGLANVVALATERARVQAQLRLSFDELRKSAEDRRLLLAHIVQAQEEERQRIADDIHDDSVQVMTAVALRLATLRRRIGEGARDPMLSNLEHDVRQSITRLRHQMFVLRPPALEAHGIAAALQAFLARVGEDEGIDCSLDDRLQREPEPDARTVVYRIAQEAVSNVCKHARASRIDVTLSEHEGGVLVDIRDDGVGFDVTTPQQAPGHLGLLVMRERAEQSGGWCTVESRHGVGTSVRYLVGSVLLGGRERPRGGTAVGPPQALAGTTAP